MSGAAIIDFPVGNTDLAIDFLERWHGSDPRVVITIHPETKATNRRDFAPDAVGNLRQFIDAAQGRLNVYYVANACAPGDTSPTKEEMRAGRALYVDLDAKNGLTLEEAEERCRGFEPAPTHLIFSGGGYQALWRMVPITDLGWADRIEATNKAIERAAGGDNCHNANRLLRLPGTINVPDAKKRERGRVPTLARIVEEDWNRTIELGTVPALPDGLSASPAPPSLSDLSERVMKAIVTGDPKLLRNPQATRSEVVFFVAASMVRAHYDDAAIAAILLDPANGVSAHVREQHDPRAYALRQAQQAREKVATDWVRSDKGAIVADDQTNVLKALDQMGVALRYDEFGDRVTAEIPGRGAQYFDDPVAHHLRFEIERRFGFRPTKDFFFDFAEELARERGRYHPVKDYLAGIEWDGVERIDRWLSRYAGAEDNEYTRAVGRLILLAAVRRIREPGCKFDQMMVLVSEKQGLGKSLALAKLAVRAGWFTDSLGLDAREQEVIEKMGGKWLVEFAELKGMTAQRTEHIKAFASRLFDRARPAYGRKLREVPRQCIFFGSTNEPKFLKDDENRRFWPVNVGEIDLDALVRDRDQLWAEAATAEASGESIELPRRLWAAAAGVQAAHHEEDPWVDAISGVLGDMVGKVRSTDIWNILGIVVGRQTQADNRRLGSAMRHLGWTSAQLRFYGLKCSCYVKGTAEEREKAIFVQSDGLVPGSAQASYEDKAQPDFEFGAGYPPLPPATPGYP